MLRIHFDRELNLLDEAVINLGTRARHAVAESIAALIEQDASSASELIAGDTILNALRYAIEQRCYELLATEQPVARDMRAIMAALTVSSEAERIADHGKRIAKLTLRLGAEPMPYMVHDLDRLGTLALTLLDRALNVFSSGNTTEARAVCLADDQVDAAYKALFSAILAHMVETPRSIGACTYLIQAAHELERVADRATNIAERVIFAQSGELSDLNV